MEIERQRYRFKTKEVWFSPPFDVTGYHLVVFHAAKPKLDLDGFQREAEPTLVIDLNQELETIWNNMSKTSTRGIRAAQKAGVEVKLNENYEEFQDMNTRFRKAKGLPQYSFPTDVLKRSGPLFTAEHDGEVVSGLAYFEDDYTIRYTVGASPRLEVGKERASLIGKATSLLHWDAINYAKRKGIREYDLGGYYTGDRDKEKMRINTFKRHFGGQLVERYAYTKYYSRMFQVVGRLGSLLHRS
jgi:lipid II:glycine glycyltransferase (peptidoglycan interpeptide bridge formation enzyme)